MASYSGTAPTIPDWLLLNSGKPSAEELAKLKAPRASMAARNTAIPILYGRERVEGKLFYAQVDKTNGFLYVGYLLCEGEADAIEAILMDGVDVTTGLLTKQGAAVNGYKGGADNVPDPLLRASNIAVGLPAYNDALPGTCYVTLKIPRGASSGFPRVEAIVRGRKVYDPRKDSTNGGSGSHRLANKATWQWSDNPTLCFADFCTQLAGWDVVWPSIAQNASYNDTLIGGLKKRTVGLLLEAQASASEWAQGFRVYMGAYLARENGAIRVVADRADVIPGTTQYNAAIAGTDLTALREVGVAYHFRPDDIKAGTLALKHRSKRNTPNSIIVEYTEARLVEGWRTETVQTDSPVIAAGAPRRNSRVSLTGIQNRAQAYRESVERLNWFLSDLEGSFTAWDEGLALQVGSIIAITHPAPVQLVAKLFRIVGHSLDNGRWSYNIAEYDPDMYSDAAVPPDDYVPPVQVDPTVVPNIVGLVAAEELFTYKDGTIRSRVRMAWSPDDSPYLQHYQVEAWVGSKLLYQTTSKVPQAYTDAVEELNNGQPTDVVVKVAAVYRSRMGAYTTTTVPVRGKQTPPIAITSAVLTAGPEQVTIDWVAPAAERLRGTEVWVSTVNNLGNAVKKGTVPYPSTSATLTGLAANVPVYVWLRLVDQVGNLSAYYPSSSTGGLTATPNDSTAGSRLNQEILDRQQGDAANATALANGLANEAQQRVAGLQQVTNDITSLSTTVNQNAAAAASALLAQKTALEAQITSLSTTLTQADVALGQRIDTISASIGEQFDSFKQWTFDTTTESWGSNGGSPTWVDGWLRPFNNSASYVQSPAPLAMSGNTYRSIKLRMRKFGNPVWSGRVRWTTDADLTWDDAKSVVIPEPKFDANGIAVVTINDLPWSGASPIRQIRIALTTNQSATTYVLYDWIAFGNPSPGASTAALQAEATARADGDTAQATARETLATQMRGGYTGTDVNAVTSGLIFSERQARSTAVEAVASSVTSLQAVLGNIGGDNLITDSSFETSNNGASLLPNWQTSSTGSTTVSYGDSPLPGSGRFVSVSGTLVGSGQYVGVEPATSLRPKAVAGQKYTNSVWAKGTPGATLRMHLQFLTAGSASGLNSVSQDFILTDTFQRYVMNPVVAAANTALARPIYRVIGGATSATLQLDVDNAQLQQGEVATQWMPSGEEMIKKNTATATAVTGLEVRVTNAEGGITSLTNQYTSLQSSLNNIGGENLVGNSSFELEAANAGAVPGWSNNSGGLSPGVTRRLWADSTLPASTRAWRWELDNVPTSGYLESVANSVVKLIKVQAGKTHTLSAYVRGSDLARVMLQFAWRDADNNTITYSGTPGASQYRAGPDWGRISWVGTAPANAVSCVVYIRVYGANVVGQWVEWDNVQVEVGDYASGYAPSVGELQATVTGQATAITGLSTRMTAAEGSITSTSNSVTSLTSKLNGLRVMGESLIPNSNFATDFQWWSIGATGGNTILRAADSGDGGPGVTITRTTTASAPSMDANDGQFAPCKPGTLFRARVRAKLLSGNGNVLLRVIYRDAANVQSQVDRTVTATAEWSDLVADFPALPSTAVRYLFRVYVHPSVGTVSFDRVDLFNVTDEVANSANASAISGLTTTVTQLGNTVTALGTSVTQVQANIGSLTAYRIMANAGLGSSPSGAPLGSGIRKADGTLLYNGNRGFNVVPINADGTLGTRVVFDTYGNAGTNGQALIDYITALPENQYFLMYTSDSVGSVQGTGTVLTALRQTMLDAGASTTTWSLVNGSRMYIFVGRRRLGAGAGIEVLSPLTPAGSTSNRQDLWCDYNLTVVAGAPVGMDGNRAAIASTEANAQGLTDLTARVTTAEGTITATSSAVTSLTASINTVITGGPNIIKDPGFEGYAAGANIDAGGGSGGTLTVIADTPGAKTYAGQRAARILRNIAPSTANTDKFFGPLLQTSQGRTYYIEAWVKNDPDATAPAATLFRFGVSTLNSAGGRSWYQAFANTRMDSVAGWTKVSGYATVTSPALTAQLWVTISGVMASGGNAPQNVALLFDNVQFQDVTDAFNAKTSAEAAASAVTAMQATVSTLNGTVTALSSQVTTLSASIDGKANASVVVAMQAQVNNQGAGGNLISNSTFPNWQRAGWGWLYSGGFGELGNPTNTTDYIPNGMMSAIGAVRPGATGGNFDFYYATDYRIPIDPNKTYCVSAYFNTHRSKARIYAEFYNAQGQIVSNLMTPSTGPSGLGRGPLSAYPRVFAIGKPPATAVECRIVGNIAGNSEADPYFWMFYPMFGEVAEGATQPPPYSAGGSEANAQWAVNVDANGRVAGLRLASNGSTTTFDVISDQFRIMPSSGGQRLEYSSNNLRIYDGGGVLRVQLGVWA